VRLLALAAQLASRLPLVAAARRAVREVEAETDATAYVAVPSYSDVLVVAASGAGAVRPWATMQASADAAGWVLLAHREAWRSSLRRVEPTLALDDDAAAAILDRGYAERVAGSARCASLAVAVPADSAPIAALAVRGPAALMDSRQALVALLERTAAHLAAEGQQFEGP
jgi:DNA-binding IclR family transcriptional regulator